MTKLLQNDGENVLLGLVVIHRDDDIALFMSLCRHTCEPRQSAPMDSIYQ